MFYGVLLNAQFFNYINYTVNEGFPQSNANCIMQDADGYLWFATQNGATRFDGFNFELINKKDGLKGNVVEHIIQDKKGAFWFSTKKGLAKYYKNSVKTFTQKDGLLSNIISRTFELPNGKILVVTHGGTNIIENDIISKVSDKIRPFEFLFRKNGDVLVLTQSTIYLFKNEKFEKTIDLIINIPPPYRSFVEDENSNLWLATNDGLYYITEKETTHYNKKKRIRF